MHRFEFLCFVVGQGQRQIIDYACIEQARGKKLKSSNHSYDIYLMKCFLERLFNISMLH